MKNLGSNVKKMQAGKLLNIVKKIIKNRNLINRTNISRFLFHIKQGNLLDALRKIKRKMNSLEVQRGIFFLNDNLYKPENIPHNYDESKVVDIIVPIYNAYEYTVKCIKSVYDNTEAKYNLYLINDCSPDVRIKSWLEELADSSRPQNLQELTIINNDNNLGFIGTINKGLELSTHDVIILNTDTELPKNWSARLLKPLYIDDLAASVTPFSNSATICSFPEFCQDNQLPQGIELEELDRIFSLYGGERVIEIPTGVGFCMAMSRKVINEIGNFDVIYGKGYGEENDWCRRAVKKGYRNVMVTNLFVYHKHGASFGEIITQTKQQRMDENLAILLKRYPDYQDVVSNFIALDPVKDIRNFLRIIVHRLTSQKEAELVLNHSLGGGATTYIHRRMAANPEKEYFYAELFPDKTTLKIFPVNMDNQDVLHFDYGKADRDFLKKLGQCLRIDRIFINQLVNYPIDAIMDMITASGLKYEYFIHDFYCVCPRYALLNENNEFCYCEKQQSVCNKCLQVESDQIDIGKWRKGFHHLLQGAHMIYAPSSNTAKIVNSYYPDLAINVVEHPIPSHIHNTAGLVQKHGNMLNITVLGAIGLLKGSRIVYELADKIAVQKLPMRITVIGYTDVHNGDYENSKGTLKILGPYHNEDVSDLLAKYNTDIVLLPSICPETYSYTVSEAIYSGYKVLAFDIGAPSDRIRETRMGWLVKEISSDAIMAKLVEISKNNE